MLKVYYCPNCQLVTYTHYLKYICRACDSECTRLGIDFEKFYSMTEAERKEYIDSQL